MVKKQKKQDKIMPTVQPAKKKMEVDKVSHRTSQAKPQKPKLNNVSVAIAGTAARTSRIPSVQNFPRHISLLRPNPVSARASIFKKATVAAIQSSSNLQTSKRIVTFGPQLNVI